MQTDKSEMPDNWMTPEARISMLRAKIKALELDIQCLQCLKGRDIPIQRLKNEVVKCEVEIAELQEVLRIFNERFGITG